MKLNLENLNSFLVENECEVSIFIGKEAAAHFPELVEKGLIIPSPNLIAVEVCQSNRDDSGWGYNYKSYNQAMLDAAIVFQKGLTYKSVANNAYNGKEMSKMSSCV